MISHKSREVAWLLTKAVPLIHLHIVSLLLIAGGSALTLVDPLIMKWLIDTVLPKKDAHLLWIGVSAFGGAYLGRVALTYSGSIVSFTAVQKILFRVRMKLVRELHRKPAKYVEALPVGEALFRIEQDVNRIGDLAGDMLPNITRMLLVSVMVVTTMCLLNRHLTIVVLPFMPCALLLQRRYRSQLVKAADVSQEKLGKTTSVLQEHLTGLLQLQLLNRHGRHASLYARQAADSTTAQIQQRMAEIRYSVAYVSMIVLGSIVILGYGGYEVIQNRLTIGGLVAFYSYVARLFEPLSIAVDLQSRTQRVSASIRRILEIEGRGEEEEAPPSNLRLPRHLLPALEFRSVSFGHGDRGSLENLNLFVEPGEKIALVGISGSGKTTIAHLATGLYVPERGSILLGGQDIRNLDRRNLRSLISLVPQDPVLFDGTLRENLLYGDPTAKPNDIEWVLSVVQLERLVRDLPRGLNEPLGPMGRALSGGEKKRVAVGRALLMRPRILILDEVTNGLDEITANRMVKGLGQFLRDTSLIFISHKREAIAAADRILVLHGGRIVDNGSHCELVLRCLPYQELYRQAPDSGPLKVAQ